LKRNDVDLVRRAVQGEKKAYDELIRLYKDAVFNIVFRMVRNKQEAEDLTQETFIKAFQSLGSFNEAYAFSTWLFKIATNNCIDFFRKRKLKTYSMEQQIRYKNEEFKHEYADSGKTAVEEMIDSEKTKMIKQAIEQLPEKYCQVIQLRHQQEKSYDEIATLLNLPLGTVKARIFRARELLKKSLKKQIF